jgi:maltooligosyltrehalose trehalohydrolase
MLFMGEEFAASTPFLYFCDFGPELAAAVTRGRRDEFGRFAAFADPAVRARIPDPNDPATFEASRLRWDERDALPHADHMALLRELLALRHEHLVPRLAGSMCGGNYRVDGNLLHVEWALPDGARWRVLAHFGAKPVAVAALPGGDTIYRHRIEADAVGLRALQGGVCVTLEAGHA